MLIRAFKAKREDGFSLVEMLIVTVVFLAVITISLQLIKLANTDVRTSKNINEVYMNARSAMKFLERDIANAGNQLLQGAGPTGGSTGPVTSREAFINITAITNAPPENRQKLFCLVPTNKEDNLGNGANQFGRADRVTISYSDEFFNGGEQKFQNSGGIDIRDPKIVNSFVASGTVSGVSFGFTTNASGGVLRVNKQPIITPDPDPSNPNGRIVTTYTPNNIKKGDLFKIDINASESPILLMVTNVVNNANSFDIVFDRNDILGFNRKSPPGTYDDDDPLDQNAFPMDVFDVLRDPGDPPVAVTATKVNIYSYMVNPTTRELIRRRYTLFSDETPRGVIDDPVCQGMERFWLSYNLFQDAAPPARPTFSQDLELDPKANIDVLDDLQFISRVNVKLIVRSQEIDRRNGRPSRLALEGSFTPRNIAYAGNQQRR